METSISIILNHLFNRRNVILEELSLIDIKKCQTILTSLGYSIESFFNKTDYSDEEKGKFLLFLLLQGFNERLLFEFLDWKGFEIVIASLFNEHGYSVIQNFRFKDEFTNYEIDVLAFKYPYLFLIDCKHYRNPTSSIIKNAATKQRERTEVIFEVFPIISEELILKLNLPLKREIRLYPLIASWRKHNVQFSSDVPIVPFNKLYGFLQEIDEYRDSIFFIPLLLN